MSPRATTTTIIGKGPLELAPINDYGNTESVRQLLGDAPVLSEGLTSYSISRYQADYQARVNAYQNQLMQKTGLTHPPTDGVVDHTFFRRQYQNLLRHIHERNLVRPPKNEKDLSITLASLLGEEGMILCRLAIEEETHSLAYREGVFARATNGYTGEPWEQQPGIIIAGPSGSGKSHAAASIIGDITGSQRVTNEHTGPVHNFLVTADGEYGRKTSHVFEDTVALADAFGFKDGVSDLHDRTKSHTESAKRILREAAYLAAETGKAGFILPETFTNYFISTNIRQAMRRFIQLCQNSRINTIFVDVEASQNAVRHDAEARAKVQSKSYNKYGFALSEFCSTYVKNLLRKRAARHINFITYTNDRILVKPQNDTWIETKYGAKGAMPVSRRVYQSWIALQASDRPDFKDYVQQQHTQALLHFEHVLRARQQLKHYVAFLKKQQKTDESLAKIAYLNQVLHKTRNNPDERSSAIVDSLIKLANEIKVRHIAKTPLAFFSQQERKLIVALMHAMISNPGESLDTSANLFLKHQDMPIAPTTKSAASNRTRNLSENFMIVFNPTQPDQFTKPTDLIASNEDDFDDDLHPFINSAKDAIVAYHERGLQPELKQRIENLLIDIDNLLEIISEYPATSPGNQIQGHSNPEIKQTTSLSKQIQEQGKRAIKQANKLANKVDALTDKVLPKDPPIVMISMWTWKHIIKPVGNYLTRQATPAINQLRQAVGMEPLQTAMREHTQAALDRVYPKFMENLYTLINFNLSINELIRKNPDPKTLTPKTVEWLQGYWEHLQRLQMSLANNPGLREKINGKLNDRQALETLDAITKKIFDYYYRPAHLTVEEKRKILSDKEESMLANLAQTLRSIIKEPMQEPITQDRPRPGPQIHP